MLHGEFILTERLAVKAHIVGVNVEQGHSPPRPNPFELLFPDGIGLFLEDEEERGVLHQRVRQFDIAVAFVGGDPKGSPSTR